METYDVSIGDIIMEQQTLTLVTADRQTLVADLTIPAVPVRATAVIAPAMAVPRRLYRSFAAYLATRGVATIVPDYRGIGDSVVDRGRDVRVDQWAYFDVPAALAELHRRWPDAARVWIGHSVGGQLLGLADAPPVDRALLLASQSGYWKLWSGAGRVAMAAFGVIAAPALVALTGRLPMRLVGGLDVPAGAARQWAAWIRDPQYIAGAARQRETSGFDRFAGPLRAYAITDDAYAPRAGVAALVAEFRRADAEIVEVSPMSLGLTKLGHFGVVRQGAAVLWQELGDFVLAASDSGATAADTNPDPSLRFSA
jgi:predicted alpha/beta hydrolase